MSPPPACPPSQGGTCKGACAPFPPPRTPLHVPDLKCVPDLERVPDFNVLFKQFPYIPRSFFQYCSNIFKKCVRSLLRNNGIVLDNSVRSRE